MKNTGAASTGSFFECLFERFHDEFVGLAVLVQKAEGEFARKASDEDVMNLFATSHP